MGKQETAVAGLDNEWCTFTSTGLHVLHVPTFEEWESLGIGLKAIKDAIPFWIGDFMLIGQTTFGEKYSQAVELFGEYSIGHVNNCMHVMSKVAPERRTDLSFSHNSAVARLEPQEQEFWLREAEAKKLTASELVVAIRGPREGEDKPATIEDVISEDPIMLVMDRAVETGGLLLSSFSILEDVRNEAILKELKFAEVHLKKARELAIARLRSDLEDELNIDNSTENR